MKNLLKVSVAVLVGLSLTACCNKHQNCQEKTMNYLSETFSSYGELPWIDVKPGITRQIVSYKDDLMLVRVRFDSTMVGKRPPLHSHPHSQISYVLSGKFEVHVGDSVRICGPGDSYIALPNVPHEAYVIEPGDELDCFTPMREEFVNPDMK